MKKVTLDKILDCLEEDCNEVFVDDETRLKALVPLERMLELAAK
jgi:quinolinate synthase